MKAEIQNKEGISARQLAQMCKGRLLGNESPDTAVHALCTDSREAEAGVAFVALRGSRVDGHDYIETAIANGCRCVICEKVTEAEAHTEVAYITVADSEAALSALAAARRENLNAAVVAVTGSVGKTTTKDAVAAVLASKKRVYASKGNHNSVIGMPLSMMEIPKECDCAVLEMGMSGFGEIERMSLAAAPNIAIITNIGTSHMEALGSRKGICRAKLEILCGLQTGGTLLLNGDEPLLRGVGGKSYRTMYVSLTCEKADFYAQNIRILEDRTCFDVVTKEGVCRELAIPVCGRHNVYAALYAYATGKLLGLYDDEIREGLWHFTCAEMRQSVYAHKDVYVLEDCYNASPESMRAAIDVLAEQASFHSGRSIAVLGDMLELGKTSDALHRSVGAHLAERRIDLLVALGAGGEKIAEGAREGGMEEKKILVLSDATHKDAVARLLSGLVRKGDTILFKASRGVRLEQLIQGFKEAYQS